MFSIDRLDLKRGWGAVSNVVLDPSIVCSFDQTGFLRHRLQFAASDLEVDRDGLGSTGRHSVAVVSQ